MMMLAKHSQVATVAPDNKGLNIASWLYSDINFDKQT